MTGLGCLRTWAIALLMLIMVPLAAWSQSDLDYSLWRATAERAEEALSAGRASNTALETLRVELTDWRAGFQAAQDENRSRIETIQSQIAALGAVPDDGTEEPQDIRQRREELDGQLTKLRAPVVKAEEAYNRADGIIREIDTVIRERQASRLLTLGPSPLNPTLWSDALATVGNAVQGVWSEVARALDSPVLMAEMRINIVPILLMLVLAVILMWKGRAWVFQIADLLRLHTRRGTGVWTFFVSVGLIILPLFGLSLLIATLEISGLVGLRGSKVLDQVFVAGFALLGARWLGVQLFTDQGGTALMPIAEDHRPAAHWFTVLLGLVLVVGGFLDLAVELEGAGQAEATVLMFPVLVVGGLILFRFGQVLLRGSANLDPTSGDVPFRLRSVRLVGRAIMVVAIFGPVLAAIGYATAAEALMLPTILSLALLGLLLVLQRFVGDFYRLLTGTSQSEGEGLIPTLIGFVLVLASAPAFALVWGVRPAELTELWSAFRKGISIGETRISPTDFLTFVVIFALGFAATRLLQASLRSSVLPKTRIDPGGQTAIVSGLGYVGIFLAALIAITATGLDLSSLAIVAGALSVGIGFGLQNIVSNFVSGIILLIERPISEGDWIEVGGNMGYVRAISVRSTRIETFDRTDVIVPNADFVSGTVTNYTRGNTIGRVIVPVGVAYGTDTRKVEAILRKIAEAHEMVLMNPPPAVIFQGFGADSLDFEIRAILRDVNSVMSVKSDMNHEINRIFTQEGIEIPFAQRDVWLRNPEALRPPEPQGDASESDATDTTEGEAP